MNLSRFTLAALVLATIAGVVGLRAQEPSKFDPAELPKVRDDIRLNEQILARMFAEFERSLLQLKQRLERSPKQEDRDRAVVLATVFEESRDLSIAVQFEQMLDFLQKSKLAGADLQIGQQKATKL